MEEYVLDFQDYVIGKFINYKKWGIKVKQKPIYVEINMNAPIDTVWEYTQNPKLHEQWDLRFSEINYIPKETEESPQTFTYKTNVLPFISVEGWGESKGTHHKQNGSKTSSLHFGTVPKISTFASVNWQP